MEQILINPTNYDKQYLNFLNKCFKNWGQNEVYSWVFERPIGNIKSDIIIIKDEEGEVIAGSGISYRKLISEEGIINDISIMTGSWTLPKARGKGAFSKMIEVSKQIAFDKGVPLLTAFVTESNASFRRLESAGSKLLPTYHLFSPSSFSSFNLLSIEEVERDENLLRSIFSSLSNSAPISSFVYTFSEFVTQYIERPQKTKILKIGDEYVIFEETDNILKVLLLTYQKANSKFESIIKSLTNWGNVKYNKKTMYFTANEELKELCIRNGFENLPGYFTILATSNTSKGLQMNFKKLNINSGDKM